MNEDNFNATDNDVDQPLDGQVEFADEEAVESDWMDDEANYPDYIDVNEYGDKHVIIKVDGEEVEVPLKEALAGYQRQADYTRKTQELSKQKQGIQTAAALAEALERDPHGTLSLLQQHYGVNTPVQAPQEDVWVDPLVKELEEIKAWKRELEYQQTLSQVEKEILDLERKYGEDFDREEVIARALATGSQNLEETFKLIQFDKVYAERTEATKKVAETTKRTQAKKSAQVVSGASSSKGGGVAPAPKPTSVLDAWTAAEKALGL